LIATRIESTDGELVAAVRQGDDAAFEELYARYRPRISSYVRGMLRDQGRAEDVTQEAFFSALRRLRETDSEIDFKPWIYRIARNQAIDHHRRTSRAEEISMDAERGLRPSDHNRLVDAAAPDRALVAKERLDHLCGAFDELPDLQSRVLVMRELEGRSYREIADELELTRPAVESALFRARRRLESEYEELSEGRRCAGMGTTIARLAEGVGTGADQARLARHARRCSVCRCRARELGVEPLSRLARARAKVAALLPLPWGAQGGGGPIAGMLSERAAALAAIAAIGAGGAAVGIETIGGDSDRPAGERQAEPAQERRVDPAARPGSGPADSARSGARRGDRSRRQGTRGVSGTDDRERLRGATPRGAPAPGRQTAAAQPSGGAAPGRSSPATSGQRLPQPTRVVPETVERLPKVEVPRLQLPQVEVPPVQLPAPSPNAPGADLVDGVNGGVEGIRGGVNGALEGVTGGANGALDGATGTLQGALP
jgi:RNA polymerase sigma factor (sigma-70 family)